MADQEKLPTDKRKIKYEYSPIEIYELSMQLANKTKEFASITDEKKVITGQYGSKLNEIKATQNKLSNQVTDGYELRDAEFTIHYHVPMHGQKTLRPVEPGLCEEVVEKMVQWEFNLFNQEAKVSDDENKLLSQDRVNDENLSSDEGALPWENLSESVGDGTSTAGDTLNLDQQSSGDPVFDKQDKMLKEKQLKDKTPGKVSTAHIPQADPEAMARVAEEGAYSTDTGRKKTPIEKKSDKEAKRKAKSPFKSDNPGANQPVGELLQKERDKLKGKKK